jgi:hypothetical protein
MTTKPTSTELASERARLQRELFRLLDEKRRLGIGQRHRNYWSWQQSFDQAKDKLQRFDDQWGNQA